MSRPADEDSPRERHRHSRAHVLRANALHTNRDRVRCSCPMCGNPRRWWHKRPVGELLLREADAADLEATT